MFLCSVLPKYFVSVAGHAELEVPLPVGMQGAAKLEASRTRTPHILGFDLGAFAFDLPWLKAQLSPSGQNFVFMNVMQGFLAGDGEGERPRTRW